MRRVDQYFAELQILSIFFVLAVESVALYRAQMLIARRDLLGAVALYEMRAYPRRAFCTCDVCMDWRRQAGIP